MSELIAIAYPDEFRAAEVRATLARLQLEYLVDLEDAVVVRRNRDGDLKLDQPVNLTAAGAVGGAFWGGLIGLLFLMPFAGAAIGAGLGALSGKLTDLGISDEFIKALSANLPQGSSALFVLVKKATPDKVVPQVAKFGGTVLRTSLSTEAEAKLREAFADARTA